MPPAIAISLTARPIQSVDLCFEVSGIIGEQNFALAALGQRVTRFDLGGFYSHLLDPAGAGGRPGLLKYDSATIHTALTSAASGGPLLFALRAENVKALLDKAIKSRENSYYKKFVNKAGVINITQSFFNPSADPAPPRRTKPDSLEVLVTTSQQQYDALNTALTNDPSMAAVVKATTTDMVSYPINCIGNTTNGSSRVAITSGIANISPGNGVFGTGIPPETIIVSVDMAGGAVTLSKNATANGANVNLTLTNVSTSDTANFNSLAKDQPTEAVKTTDYDKPAMTTVKGYAEEYTTSSLTPDMQTTRAHADSQTVNLRQHTESRGYTFRYPVKENDADFQRTQVSLIDERFKQFMYSQHLPYLSTVFDNDRDSIDLDVKRLQVSYVNTILVSPIDGVVTGIFQDPGDCVQAGQPVMRVEQDKEILIVGTIKFRDLLKVGYKVDITTNLFDKYVPNPAPPPPVKPAQPVQLPQGKIVAIRGHKHEDELWDVIIWCTNPVDGNGDPMIPINYNFDYDDTTVVITP